MKLIVYNIKSFSSRVRFDISSKIIESIHSHLLEMNSFKIWFGVIFNALHIFTRVKLEARFSPRSINESVSEEI